MKRCTKYLALLFVVVSILSISASAVECSNKYIRSGGGYIHRWGAGDISVEFNVVGTDIMDTIGAHRVTFFRMTGESPNAAHDDIVATYWHGTYPGLMITGSVAYSNSIRIQVEPGQQYYAVIIFYATLDGGGDDMAFCTKPKTA